MWDAIFQCLEKEKDLEEYSRGHKVLISNQCDPSGDGDFPEAAHRKGRRASY